MGSARSSRLESSSQKKPSQFNLTLEHYLSDDLLEAISADNKVVMVEGAAWQGGRMPSRRPSA